MLQKVSMSWERVSWLALITSMSNSPIILLIYENECLVSELKNCD
ncbi:hypothetical protein [Providencia hangzhouensis]